MSCGIKFKTETQAAGIYAPLFAHKGHEIEQELGPYSHPAGLYRPVRCLGLSRWRWGAVCAWRGSGFFPIHGIGIQWGLMLIDGGGLEGRRVEGSEHRRKRATRTGEGGEQREFKHASERKRICLEWIYMRSSKSLLRNGW